MSDLDGERAFEMVLDRLETRHHEFEDERRKHDDLRQQVWKLEQEIKRLETENRNYRLLGEARARSGDPPAQAAAADDPAIPF